jgi:hypothetical protein
MFSWFKSFFSRTDSSATDSKAFRVASEQPIKPNAFKPEMTWVFIWRMNGGKNADPGHAAIQIGGSRPKMNPDDEGDYASIHPKNIPSFGPMSLFPLPGALAGTLVEDMESQRASQDKDCFLDPDTVPMASEHPSTPLAPDDVYLIPNLDTSAMKARMHNMRQSVAAGKTRYQLFPNLSLFGLLSHIPTEDTFNTEVRGIPVMPQRVSVNNCTTFVKDLLSSGGAHIKESSMPWGITPDGLATEVAKVGELRP